MHTVRKAKDLVKIQESIFLNFQVEAAIFQTLSFEAQTTSEKQIFRGVGHTG